MNEVKIYNWTSSSKNIKAKVGNRVLELKVNCSLFERMEIVARSIPETYMAYKISLYELTGVPRSLFAPDGSLLPSQDKSKLMPILEALPGESNERHSEKDEPNIPPST